MKLKRVLIANRGEIALRVVRTLRTLGIESIVGHAADEAHSLPVRLADGGIILKCDGPPHLGYLSVEAVVEAARASGADAVHPGYGFLSEREELAREIETAGRTYLGPSPENVKQLGDKGAAREALANLGLPPVPGVTLPSAGKARAQRAAEVGFPLLLKATAGGGGRGIRIVHKAADLPAALETASSEATTNFGSGELVAERYLTRARHIEVQVVGDGRGGISVFYERDCSTQRRLQKIFEETPSPAVTSAQREKLLANVAEAMARLKYRSAGTLEFLLAESGEVFFLEMNTRIQVEHPITEATSGVDLVARQVAIAEGEALPEWRGRVEDHVLPCDGVAVEFRVNAEDPLENFRPSTGRIENVRFPSGPEIRVDTAVEPGTLLTPYYDSLVAKIIARGGSRKEALARLRTALTETRIDSVATTIPLGLRLLEDADFLSARNHCQYLEERMATAGFFPPSLTTLDIPLAAAAAACIHARAESTQNTVAKSSVAAASLRPSEISAWRAASRWGDAP